MARQRRNIQQKCKVEATDEKDVSPGLSYQLTTVAQDGESVSGRAARGSVPGVQPVRGEDLRCCEVRAAVWLGDHSTVLAKDFVCPRLRGF